MAREDRAERPYEAIILSPPGNPAAFPEVKEFLGERFALHDWRFAESDLPTVHDMVRHYRDELPEEILPKVEGAGVQAMFIACTGMSYGHDPRDDHEYWRGLEDDSGIRVGTATRAVEEVWRDNGYDSMILVSPYDDLATSQAEQYWAKAGLPVEQTLRVQGGHPYKVLPSDLEEAFEGQRLLSGIPLLMSGTGMRTTESLAWIEGLHDGPVWSVNLAGARWLQAVAK